MQQKHYFTAVVLTSSKYVESPQQQVVLLYNNKSKILNLKIFAVFIQMFKSSICLYII